MDVPSHGWSKKVGGRWVVKGQLQGIYGPIGGLGTFTACTIFLAYYLWHFGASGCAGKSRWLTGIDSQEALTAV